MWVCIPGQDSWVLLIPAGFLEEGFLGLRKHEQLQHFCAAGADVKGGNFIQLRSHNIMEYPAASCKVEVEICQQECKLVVCAEG